MAAQNSPLQRQMDDLKIAAQQSLGYLNAVSAYISQTPVPESQHDLKQMSACLLPLEQKMKLAFDGIMMTRQRTSKFQEMAR